MINFPTQNIDYRLGQKWRCSVLVIWIFSGIGIPIFQFSGSLFFWCALLFLGNFKAILLLPARMLFLTAFLMFSYVTIYLLKGAEPPYFVLVTILSALFVLSKYLKGDGKFYSDFSLICKGFMYYSILSIPIMVLGSELMSAINFGYFEYETLGYLFWFSPKGGPAVFNELRMTGLTWEPGIWQIFLNINFLFALSERRSVLQVALAIIATITSFSTTGLFVTAATYFLFLLFVSKKLAFRQLLLPIFIVLLFGPAIINNVSEKLTGEHMGSGATRISDFFSGAVVLSENPVLGAHAELLNAKNNPNLVAIKTFFWNGNFTDGAFEAYLTVPNSNGYMIFLIDWGLPLGLFLLWHLFKGNLFPDSRSVYVCMIIIILISMSAEAISRTSFFYFFILAACSVKPKLNSASVIHRNKLQN